MKYISLFCKLIKSFSRTPCRYKFQDDLKVKCSCNTFSDLIRLLLNTQQQQPPKKNVLFMHTSFDFCFTLFCDGRLFIFSYYVKKKCVFVERKRDRLI